MEGGSATLGIQVVVGADADDQELAEATSRLRRELLELDVESVEPARAGDAPSGVRAVEIAALGTLIVTLAKSELLAAVVSAVRSWIGSVHGRSVKLEVGGDVLELTGVSSAEQQRLSNEWLLRRHALSERPVQAAEEVHEEHARSALIVASYDYQDPGLRRLRAPAHDAEALARVLHDPNVGGFDVRTMLNEPAYVINEAVEEFFADRSRDDLLLLHFSCHGLKDEGGELYFAAANTKLRRLGATAVAADFVNRRMSRSRSQRVVLLLDCCYAGAFERGMTARAGSGVGIDDHFGGRGRAVITASSAMEYAFEGDDLADAQEGTPSVFTKALVDGLETGDADRDQDGYVALDELYDYVYDRVREATPNQTPGKWTFAVEGDLHIARRGRPVTTPPPLPLELQQATDHPLAQVRAGAVQELERLLETRHAGMALAAKLTLEQLTNDDSRMVSAAAAAALGGQLHAAAEIPSTRDAPPVERSTIPMTAERRATTTSVPPSSTNEMVDQPAAPSAADVVGSPGRADSLKRSIGPRQEQRPVPPPAGKEVAPSAQAQDAGVAYVDRGTAGRADADRRLGAAGGMSIAGAALLILSLFPPYWTQSERHLVDHIESGSLSGAAWYALIMATLAFGAGILIVRSRTKSLIGSGMLVGAGGAASVRTLSSPFEGYGITQAAGLGLWLDVAAHVVIVLAAGLAGLALIRLRDVRIQPHRPKQAVDHVIIFLGTLGGASVLYQFALNPFGGAAIILGTTLVIIVPALATMAWPRRFGVGLLVGWIWGGTALAVLYYMFEYEFYTADVGPGPMLAFAGTLLVMLLLVIPFVRAVNPAIPSEPTGTGSAINERSN